MGIKSGNEREYIMLDRRQFIVGAGAALVSAGAGCADTCNARSIAPVKMRSNDPQSALVLWYGQTGHTQRLGRLLGKTFETEGLQTTVAPLRDFDLSAAASFDLVVIGSPVHYMDVPPNVVDRLTKLPSLERAPVAAWVTYGNKGSNPINTGWNLVELLTAKGGVPVGMSAFSNMNTFAPVLTGSGAKRTLRFKHLPDAETYERCRQFAHEMLKRVRANQVTAIDHEFDFSGMLTAFKPMWWSKKLIGEHHVDHDVCVKCGACAATCPVGAIDPAELLIDRERCILCCGCINNCPAEAVRMTFMGDTVIGWPTFCRDHHIKVVEPPELS